MLKGVILSEIDSRNEPIKLAYFVTPCSKYVWRYVRHNSSACYAYVMWEEIGHCHFLYVPAGSNVVTTGNGTGTKVLKWNCALGFEFSIQSSVFGATTVAKVSLFSTWIRSTVSFYYIKRRNRPVQTSVI